MKFLYLPALFVLGFVVTPHGAIAHHTPSTEPIAQTFTSNFNLNNAKNLARQAAERENGGLNYYRAESSMYGPATESPFKDNGDGTLTFTFLGGYPAAPPAIQTVVTVDVAGDQVTVDYNGPIPTAQN